jgi:hypothetical protein
MRESSRLNAVPDDLLLRRLSNLVRDSRRVEADLVAHIGEVDARKLYAREAMPSMFAYCTRILHLSEFEAYLRITAARASREHPTLLTMLRDGRLHLSAVARLASHLTPDNRGALLNRAAHRSKREIEELIAELRPRPDAQPTIRKLPTRSVRSSRCDDGQRPRELATVHPARESATAQPTREFATARPGSGRPGTIPQNELVPERVESPSLNAGPDGVPLLRVGAASSIPAQPSETGRGWGTRLEALSPSRHRVQFTASDELRDKLERLQALMRATVPDGDLATIIDLAVTEKLARLEARRFGRTKAPRKSIAQTNTKPTSRRVPAAVRRAVYERDKGRCTFVDKRGRRCRAGEGLEFHHHQLPFGRGGNHSTNNIRLMCRAHNQLLAERDFGKEKMARYRRRRRSEGQVSEPAAVYGGNCVVASA